MSNEDDNSELICVQNYETQRCDENCGIPSCLVLIRKNKWEKIVSDAKSIPKRHRYVEQDNSSGAHGCIIGYNIVHMINKCKVYDNLSADVIDFIHKVEDDTFLTTIIEDINGILLD
jgi:hypothetical protein